jgi:rhodanese-related sulfurtransferase
MKPCSVTELRALLAADGTSQIIDVREFSEYEAEHIRGARLMPLSQFAQHASAIAKDRPVYLLCRTDNRARQAAQQLKQLGHQDVRIVEGGMQAWAAAALPLERGASCVWSLERQVRFTAGLIVSLGILLAATVHPWFIGLAGFIGIGLVFAAVTDTCGMGMVLARMPWNQRPQSTNDVSCAVAE